MYKTGFLKVKTQILESIFAELPQTAKKVKLTIKFDDSDKLNTFKRLESERKQQEECTSLNSGSESEGDEIQQALTEKEKKELIQPKARNANMFNDVTLNYNKIPINLEDSIIYKQFYEKRFNAIGQKYKVRINIRAEKISFEGPDIEDIEDAISEARQLTQCIEVEYLHKNGLEMFNSQFVQDRLNKVGVKIFRILDKFYRWYQISQKLSSQQKSEQKRKIKQVLVQVDKQYHCIQYLHSIEKEVDIFRGSRFDDYFKNRQKVLKYRPLLEKLKAKMFEDEFKQKFNQQLVEEQMDVIELNIDNDAIVFHSKVDQYLELVVKGVKDEYQKFDYFFLTIESIYDIEGAINALKKYQFREVLKNEKKKSIVGEIQEVKEINYIHFETNFDIVKQRIEQKMNDPGFCGQDIPKENVIFCIGFRRKSPQKRLEYLCEILEDIQKIWYGASYKISILLDQSEETEENRITSEYNSIEKIFTMTANAPNIETNLQILREYVIKKKLQIKRTQQLILEGDEHNVSITTINPNSIIQQSALLQNYQQNSKDLNTSTLEQNANKNNENILENKDQQKDQKCLTALKNYKTFIAETNKQYNDKYKADPPVEEKTIVKTDKRNRGIEDQLAKIIGSNFQVFKVQIHPSHKINGFYENVEKDEIVTVYLSGKISPFVKPKQLGLKIVLGQEQNDTFSVRPLGIFKQSMTENGYLLNIRKRDIQVQGKGFRVKYGAQFEVAKEIVYLKKN